MRDNILVVFIVGIAPKAMHSKVTRITIVVEIRVLIMPKGRFIDRLGRG